MLSYMAGVGWCLFMYKNFQQSFHNVCGLTEYIVSPPNSCIANIIYAQSLNAAMFVVHILCGYVAYRARPPKCKKIGK